MISHHATAVAYAGSSVGLATAATWPDDEISWPSPHTPVLGRRQLRHGADPAVLSTFGDGTWRLNAAHPDASAVSLNIQWQRIPAGLVLTFKAFALAALDHPFPVDPSVRRDAERPAVTTVVTWMDSLRPFAVWLDNRGVGSLSDLTDADLDAYRDHVLLLTRSAGRKAALLSAVRTVWSYRIHLPPQGRIPSDPWNGATAAHLAGKSSPGRMNKTPRIAPATMEHLLAWALHMVEDFGPDIAAAWEEYHQLGDGTHPSQKAFAGLDPSQRIELFVRRAHTEDIALPGQRGHGEQTVNYTALARMLNLRCTQGGRRTWNHSWSNAVTESGLPIASGSPVGTITARLHGQPWRQSPITAEELPQLVLLLSAAAFIVICYLSGMRPGEVLNLRRGCADTDPTTAELLIRGRLGKGHDRLPATESDPQPDRPWVVVQPVHTAIAVLERLTALPFLFPASAARPGNRRRATDTHARTTNRINRDIETFIDWVNSTFTGPAAAAPIPSDPVKHIHASRLRRTLAYFIVRRPRGLIAAALQYAHVSTKVTLGYSGYADTSWLDDLAIERLEMVLDQADEDRTRLDEGEHVSGPSAADYKTRVAHTARFAGRTVQHARNAQRLLAQTGPGVHHGQAMTCVWRTETAACRNAKLDDGLPAPEAPDESKCRTACPNLAYTDRDIEQQHRHLNILQIHATDPLAPTPRRDRAAAQAKQIQAIIDRHEQTGPSNDTPRTRGARR
jgi:integrase